MPMLDYETFGNALDVRLSITSAKVRNVFEICKQIPYFNIPLTLGSVYFGDYVERIKFSTGLFAHFKPLKDIYTLSRGNTQRHGESPSKTK